MNALNILNIVSKVSSVVYLVLEQDPRNFVSNEVCRLDGIVRIIQEIVP